MLKVFIFGLVLVSCHALPAQTQQTSALDLLKDLENVVREDGKALIVKMVNVLHHVEVALVHLDELVPKAYEKIHQEADEILVGLKKVSAEIQELIGKQNALFGFDLLGSLTELSGGTKLSTALHLLSLADKAHRVMTDAKELQPRLKTTIEKIQSKLESHVHEFAKHVLKEMGLPQDLSLSMVKTITDLLEQVEEKGHALILSLLQDMELTFNVLKAKLPEEYVAFEGEVLHVRSAIQTLLVEIKQSLVMRSFSLLDLAGNVSDLGGGTKLSTAFKVMSLLDKFNTVVQDVKNFSPRAKGVLDHSVKKVANRAQDFFSHAADKLLQ